MDDVLFQETLQKCNVVAETNDRLEILNYNDPPRTVIEDRPLPDDDFEPFLRRVGDETRDGGATAAGGVRLIVQKRASHPETFAPWIISLAKDRYTAMVKALGLPTRAIEAVASVSLLFWSSYNYDADDPRMFIVFRKADARKKGHTRGWEVVLSYSFRDGITTGFVKGTPGSPLESALAKLVLCTSQVEHPFLLPVLLLMRIPGGRGGEEAQREAREAVRRLEHSTSMGHEADVLYLQHGALDLDAVGRDLVQVHAETLRASPATRLEVVADMRAAMDAFWERIAPERRTSWLDKTHHTLLTRLDFYERRLRGLHHYVLTTQSLLALQQFSFNTVISHRNNAVSLESNKEQRHLAYQSTRDSDSMKALALVGIVFLPGTFLSSLFSTTFFDFKAGSAPVSDKIWLYFATTVPITACFVVGWLFWERKRRNSAKFRVGSDDAAQLEQIEQSIMAAMRQRTLSKTSAYKASGYVPREQEGQGDFPRPENGYGRV